MLQFLVRKFAGQMQKAIERIPTETMVALTSYA
jgi:hypothetical protein